MNINYAEKLKELNKGEKLYYYILTMGCSLNENDSEKLCGMIEEVGYERTEDVNIANVYIINTCCVRENAEERVFGKLGEFKVLKEKNNSIIAIGGCMMQEEHITDKLKKSYPFIDVIFGTHTLHKFIQDLYNVRKDHSHIVDILDIDGEIYEGMPIKRQNDWKALVTIMYGCNNYCTYCIVPYVRGRERSRHPEDILNEIKELASDGYKEITLLGQNVNSYAGGVEPDGHIGSSLQYTFAKLLQEVEKIEGIEKISFLSPHPKDFTDDVIDVIAESKKISRLLHIPLQSGSTSVLKKMNRKYTKESYLGLVEKISKKVPDVVFSTDVIVGFPGETEEDFSDTLDVVRKVNFEQIFMFIYSIRKGTIAEKMEDQIPEEVKHERFNRLKEIYEKRVEESNKKYIEKTYRVLVEGYSKNNRKMLTGRTDSNKIVVFEGTEDKIGEVVDIKILSEHKWYLKGKIIS